MVSGRDFTTPLWLLMLLGHKEMVNLPGKKEKKSNVYFTVWFSHRCSTNVKLTPGCTCCNLPIICVISAVTRVRGFEQTVCFHLSLSQLHILSVTRFQKTNNLSDINQPMQVTNHMDSYVEVLGSSELWSSLIL